MPVLELIRLIYDAAVDVPRWHTFLDAYGQAVGGRCSFILLSNEHSSRIAPFRSSNCLDGHATDDLSQILDREPEGAIRIVEELLPRETSEECDSPRNFHHGLAGVFLRTGHRTSTIFAVRNQEDGPFGVPAMSILRPLIPHLRIATTLQQNLFSLRMQVESFTIYIDRHPYPFLVIDEQARVMYANGAAYETASLKDGLAILTGRLSLMCHGSQATFMKAVVDTTMDRDGPARWLDVERPSRKPPYRLLLMPVPLSHAVPIGFSQPVVAIVVVHCEPRSDLDPAVLRELFGLTPTEARVTGKLGAGRSAKEIADEMCVSLETVRTHIRRVLSKTSTGRQGELISLVLRTMTFRAPGTRKNSTTA